MRQDLVILHIALLLLLLQPLTTTWLPASHHRDSRHLMCDNIIRKNRNSKMAKLCKDKPFLVEQIQLGMKQAEEECAYQFQYRRWNCTLKGRKKMISKDTREAAFLHAITAANVAYTITKACIMDESCKCNKRKQRFIYHPQSRSDNNLLSNNIPPHVLNISTPQSFIGMHKMTSSLSPQSKSFKWGDCSNNVKYGIRISKQWLDSRFKKKSKSDIRTKIMLHNYVAGRLAIQRYMKQECKCHGLSASCTFSVCFSRMPPFREIGNRLRERFDGAVKVISGNDGHSSSFIQADMTIKPAADEDLVYTDDSPDFCLTNVNLGVQGVAGRKCNDSSAGEDGCAIMCCGLKAVQIETLIEVNDQCQFIWCCNVTCKTRNVTRIDHVCPDVNAV